MSDTSPISKEEAARVLKIGEPYLKLRTQLEKDLKKSGFIPASEPPCEEPYIQGNISDMSEKSLKDMYDKFLAFYDYLTDLITHQEVYLHTTKERSDTIYAAIFLEAMKDKALSNAEARKCFVQIHPAYMVAKHDYLYCKQYHAAQEERRRKISKSMDRLYRELMLRAQRDSPSEAFPAAERQHRVKNMFRPISG